MSELAGTVIGGLILAAICAVICWYVYKNPPKE